MAVTAWANLPLRLCARDYLTGTGVDDSSWSGFGKTFKPQHQFLGSRVFFLAVVTLCAFDLPHSSLRVRSMGSKLRVVIIGFPDGYNLMW